jgi:integrase
VSFSPESLKVNDQLQQVRVYSVIDGLKPKHTIIAYRNAFRRFLKFNEEEIKDERTWLQLKTTVVESKIIDYVNYLKDTRKLAYRSIGVHLSAIFHFFEMNDYPLNRKKIKRFLPEDESDHHLLGNDRPYSIPEIEQILAKCDVRSRAAVLLMTSTGMRIGGLQSLRIGDIRKMDEFGLYLIWVYNRSNKDRYYTFCSPECAVAIDQYLKQRQQGKEEIKDKSPLIRERCGPNNYWKAPRFLSDRGISILFDEVLMRAKMTTNNSSSTKSKVAKTHGFRKFFITQCDRAGMPFTTREYLSGHRLPNQDASYIRMTEEDRLAEYVKVIPLLTMDPTQRLERENQELRKDYLAELGELREEFNQMKSFIVSLDKDRQKKLVHKLYEETEDEVMDDYTNWAQNTTEGQEWHRKNVQRKN